MRGGIKVKRGVPLYATNLLTQEKKELEDIRQAKAEVDANEK